MGGTEDLHTNMPSGRAVSEAKIAFKSEQQAYQNSKDTPGKGLPGGDGSLYL